MNNKNNIDLRKILTTEKNPWKKILNKTIEKTETNENELLSLSRRKAKETINRQVWKYQIKRIMDAAEKNPK